MENQLADGSTCPLSIYDKVDGVTMSAGKCDLSAGEC